MEKQRMYFITVMEKMEFDALGWPVHGDRRCFGYYSDKDHAFQIVINNFSDLNETIYDFAVIEALEEGITPLGDERWFFKFDYQEQKYFQIEEPNGMEIFSNFALG